MKKCKCCQKEKPFTDFYKSEKSKAVNVCKICMGKNKPDSIRHLPYEIAFYNHDKLIELYFR